MAHMPSPRNKLVPEERVDVLRVRPQGVLFRRRTIRIWSEHFVFDSMSPPVLCYLLLHEKSMGPSHVFWVVM